MKARILLALWLSAAALALSGCGMLPDLGIDLPFGAKPPTPDVLATQAAMIVAARGTNTPRATSPAAVDVGALPTGSVAGCPVAASFVDETIPDGTRMTPGQSFVKQWRFRNSSACDWGPGYVIAFRSGERMASGDAVAIPETARGEIAAISVQMTAPATPGRYRSTWQICAQGPEGLACAGSEVWAQIVVVPVTGTPGPTPTPTQTLTPSVTPTASRTPTPSLTPTATRTPPPTQTPLPTATPTATATATASPTATQTPTITPTPSITPTPTATRPPDYRQLAMVITHPGANQDIYVAQLDGTATTRITDDPAYDAWPTWAPGGTRLALVSRRDGNAEIYVVNADGSDARNLTRSPAEDNWPSWAPDGTRLVFASGGQLCVMNASGANRNCLAETNMTAPAVWSPDGQRLIYECQGDLCVIGADGKNAANLTQQPALDFWPAWSPDGEQVAFVSGRDRNWEVYVMNDDGTRATNLTRSPSDDRWPAWSPDGRRLAFASQRLVEGTTQWDIYLIDADGTGLRRLPTGGYARMPSWSPDGQTLAFYSDQGGVLGQVCTIGATGRGMACLASGAESGDAPPAWRK